MRHTSYPFARAIDADGGGAADLQTDVMRFMAILSLCLVAIFALVQSIPAHVPAMTPKTVSAPPVAAPQPKSPEAVPAPKPEPVPVAEPMPAPPVPRTPPITEVAEPAPPVQPVNRPPPPEEPAAPTESEPRKGFTLRFASDQALTALVARDDIGFYAISDTSASRMQYDRGRVEFWQASVPKQYHEMHASTVQLP